MPALQVNENDLLRGLESTRGGKRWAPIIEPSSRLAGRAWESVHAISDAIRHQRYPPPSRQAKPHRNYEDALLLAYFALVNDDSAWLDAAVERLSLAAGSASVSASYFGLYGGLCGLGWVMEHLSRKLSDAPFAGGFQEDSADDPNEEIDAAVLRALGNRSWRGRYDLISGLVGFGLYFLERLPSEVAERGVRAVVAELEAISERVGGGIAWYTSREFLPLWQREICPDGYYNLGVAHGMPGILYLLSEVCAQGIEQERTRGLLEGGMAWLMTQERPVGSRSRFSAWVSPGVASTDSRLTWCYGDLGIMVVLLQVARRSGRADWNLYAEQFLEHCLQWPMADSGIGDAPICHGACGTAHIFNRIYQATGDRRCLDAALAWIERVLDMRQPGDGVGGYLALTRPDPSGPVIWEPSAAFLDGSGGIALTLLAALTVVEPEWDRLLLLSGR